MVAIQTPEKNTEVIYIFVASTQTRAFSACFSRSVDSHQWDCYSILNHIRLSPFTSRTGLDRGRDFFGYNSPAAGARELFKRSTDAASLLVVD